MMVSIRDISRSAILTHLKESDPFILAQPILPQLALKNPMRGDPLNPWQTEIAGHPTVVTVYLKIKRNVQEKGYHAAGAWGTPEPSSTAESTLVEQLWGTANFY